MNRYQTAEKAVTETNVAAKEQSSTAGGDNAASNHRELATQVSDEDRLRLANLTGSIFADKLVQLFQASPSSSDRPSPVTSDIFDDKSRRGEIHQEIRRIFKSKIDTSTTDTGAIVAKAISWRAAGRKRGRAGRGRQAEPPAGQFLHFTLYKDNKDTLEAVNMLSRILKVKPQSIGYAGTKDRRASTVQRCSARYISPRSLAGLNGKLRGVTTGDYDYKEEAIHLGQLSGNEFTITVKNCHMGCNLEELDVSERLEIMKANVQSALLHMAEHGWINYFGHQRFGTHKVGTHEIGQLILAGNYEGAVNRLLDYDESIVKRAENGEAPSEAHARDELSRHRACMLFKTDKNVDEAIKIMPRKYSAEVALMRHLTLVGQNSKRDFAGALMSITRGLRSMFLHAYQSYVWNHAASKRWELHGDKVVKGDLVIADTDAPDADNRNADDDDDVIHPVEDEDGAVVRARALSAEEASSGKFTISDVVLPSPGYDVIYPDNEIGTFYEEFMGRDENGALSPHKMRRMRREFSLPGRYRTLLNKFLAPPSVEFKTYTDDTEQMHPTDMDVIMSQKSSGRKRAHDHMPADEPAEKRSKVEDGEAGADGVAEADAKMEDPAQPGDRDMAAQAAVPAKLAAVLKFQLGKSAYATVVLRELMGEPPSDDSAGDGETGTEM